MRGVERDDHHTCSTRRLWEYDSVYAEIRNNPSLIAHDLARAAHNLLHLNTAHVPLISYHTALRVANRMPRDLEVLDGIDEMSTIIEQSSRHPKIKPIEIAQNELAVRALREQIPFIRHGLPTTKTIIDVSHGGLTS